MILNQQIVSRETICFEFCAFLIVSRETITTNLLVLAKYYVSRETISIDKIQFMW